MLMRLFIRDFGDRLMSIERCWKDTGRGNPKSWKDNLPHCHIASYTCFAVGRGFDSRWCHWNFSVK